MKAIYKCPHCHEETDFMLKETNLSNEYPTRKSKYHIVRRIKNNDGTWNWKNLFYMRWSDLIFLISIIILLFGFWQIHTQCSDYLADPCGFAAQTNRCYVMNKTHEEVFDINDLQIETQGLQGD